MNDQLCSNMFYSAPPPCSRDRAKSEDEPITHHIKSSDTRNKRQGSCKYKASQLEPVGPSSPSATLPFVVVSTESVKNEKSYPLSLKSKRNEKCL